MHLTPAAGSAALAAAALNDLGDVSAGSPSAGDVLEWSGSAWANALARALGVLDGDTTGNVPADTLAADGDAVLIVARVSSAGTGTNSTLTYGGTTLCTLGDGSAAGTGCIVAVVVRTGASAAAYYALGGDDASGAGTGEGGTFAPSHASAQAIGGDNVDGVWAVKLRGTA